MIPIKDIEEYVKSQFGWLQNIYDEREVFQKAYELSHSIDEKYLKYAIDNGVELVDLDEWICLCRVLRADIKHETAVKILSALWEHEDENILEIEYNIKNNGAIRGHI